MDIEQTLTPVNTQQLNFDEEVAGGDSTDVKYKIKSLNSLNMFMYVLYHR